MPPFIQLVHQFEQQQAATWALAFAPDGKRLVSSDGNTLYLWLLDNMGGWNYERALPFQKGTFPCFAPDGTMLAFGSQWTAPILPIHAHVR
jgi:WD40 repeat protein